MSHFSRFKVNQHSGCEPRARLRSRRSNHSIRYAIYFGTHGSTALARHGNNKHGVIDIEVRLFFLRVKGEEDCTVDADLRNCTWWLHPVRPAVEGVGEV